MSVSEITDEHASLEAAAAERQDPCAPEEVEEDPLAAVPPRSEDQAEAGPSAEAEAFDAGHALALAAAPDHTPRVSTCYSMALALDAFVVRITAEAPRTHAWLADHAQRAAATLVLHLAESVSRSADERPRFVHMARAAALEVDAVLTLLAHREVCSRAERRQARDVTMRLVSMLGRV